MERPTKILGVVISVLMLMTSVLARAEGQDRSKWGFELQAMDLHSSGYGALAAGFRSVNYFGGHTNLNWGYQLYVGSSNGLLGISNNDHIYTGGLSLGADGLITHSTTYELNLVTGYGDGYVAAKDISVKSMFIAPEIGAGFLLGYGWRTTLNVGYLYFPQGSGFSGFTIGIRIDRKISVTSEGLDH